MVFGSNIGAKIIKFPRLPPKIRKNFLLGGLVGEGNVGIEVVGPELQLVGLLDVEEHFFAVVLAPIPDNGGLDGQSFQFFQVFAAWNGVGPKTL